MRGSHAKLVRKRQAAGGRYIRQVLVVPMHRAPRIGTVRAIYRKASRFIPEDDLKPHFFGDRDAYTSAGHDGVCSTSCSTKLVR